jgi:hypothetical protein
VTRAGPFLHRFVARSGFEETRRPHPAVTPPRWWGLLGKTSYPERRSRWFSALRYVASWVLRSDSSTTPPQPNDAMLKWTVICLVIYAGFVLAAALPDEIDNRRYWAALKKAGPARAHRTRYEERTMTNSSAGFRKEWCWYSRPARRPFRRHQRGEPVARHACWHRVITPGWRAARCGRLLPAHSRRES